ncbi:MAG: DUF4232 domain-containing protein [Solirubrobacterales bacterium]|nr:DUF4232 domain-containing protein [Solirubrobacterales bacterium]
MTSVGRRIARRGPLWALLAVVICGIAIFVPSGAGANGPCKSGNLEFTAHTPRHESNSKTWVLAFKNTDQRCILDGYPPTELLNGHNQSILPGIVTHKLGVLYGQVVLDHNKAAYVTFSLTFSVKDATCLDHFINSAEFLKARHLRLRLDTELCHVQVSPFRETA